MSPPGLAALRSVVAGLRDSHRACARAGSPCGLRNCPWPVMWDEDVYELYQQLTDAGYSIERR